MCPWLGVELCSWLGVECGVEDVGMVEASPDVDKEVVDGSNTR